MEKAKNVKKSNRSQGKMKTNTLSHKEKQFGAKTFFPLDIGLQ